jgi:uncharacterized membrane protein YdcZ (DUF606 family)
MSVIKILPIILGGAGVIQAVMNKDMAAVYGLSFTSVINGIIVVLCAIFVFILVQYFPGYFPDILVLNKNNVKSFQWWYLIPGIIGFCLVLLVPLAIMEVGTLPVFLSIIAGQIIVSIVWDAYYENIPVNMIRVAGALLTFMGAFLVFWKK